MSTLTIGIVALLGWLLLLGVRSGKLRELDDWSFNRKLRRLELKKNKKAFTLESEREKTIRKEERLKLASRVKNWGNHEGAFWPDNLKKLIPLLEKETD